MNPLSIQKYAKMFALADVSTRASQLQREQSDLDTQSSALDTLDTALSDFQSAVDALNSETSGPVVNTASANNDSATITANSEAQMGTYTFYVSQLATAQQTTLSVGDNDIPASGTFTITMNDPDHTSMDIDLSEADADADGYVSVSELCDSINHSEDNPGVTATLVNTDGSTTLMLTSDETGAENGFTISADMDSTAPFMADINNKQDLSVAQDSIIYLGGVPGDPTDPNDPTPKVTSSSNTYDDLIPGVSITFAQESTEGEPLTFTIANDSGATQEKVQTFVDAYNTLVDTLDSLTSNGSDGSAPGPFAGDAGISSLENQIQDITHATYNGVSIIDYGITLDSDGHLQIDSETFDAEMEENPDGLTSLFVGDDSMTAQLDDVMDTYLNDSDGIIMQRQTNIDDQQDQLTSETDQIKETYNSAYDRYISEFTSTMVEISTMQMSMAAFA
ncbi:flagellar filament capping protein FliD [Buttiauxella gaviniae]|uniref:flagellar filament capping protein FliD n=1 Tax=Buttiauxella gaviniae TaxID=82990 RepID=UPI0039751901